MTTQEFLVSAKGQRRTKEIAKEMNRAHGISMKQCMQFARKEVEDWYNVFGLFGQKKG